MNKIKIKKISAILLAVALTVSGSAAAFADDVQPTAPAPIEVGNYTISWKFDTYQEPDFTSKKLGTFTPQEITILSVGTDGWVSIGTYSGVCWVNLIITDPVTIAAIKVARQLEKFQQLPFYDADNASRYFVYALAHPELSTTSAALRVNIGLDTPFYSSPDVIADPNSLLVLCNKYHQLAANYVPPDLVAVPNGQLRSVAATAYNKMAADMKAAGVPITISSPYRSFATQTWLYNGYVAQDGQAKADTYSARPGFSEHQTGLAFDISHSGDFSATKQFAWLVDNAYKYGFILRYPKGCDAITGYEFEPWHWRYVGVDVATFMRDNKIATFDEYCAEYLQ